MGDSNLRGANGVQVQIAPYVFNIRITFSSDSDYLRLSRLHSNSLLPGLVQ